MTIDKAANFAVITAALAVSGTVIYDRFTPGLRTMDITANQRFVGKRLPLPATSVPWHLGAEATVVVFVSKNCRYCLESMSFYKELADLRMQDSGALTFVVAFPSGVETTQSSVQLFGEHGVVPDSAEPMEFGALGNIATPTLVLVDSAGVARSVWVGKLPRGDQRTVVSKLRDLCRSCKRSGT